jgi:Protein of unknown function (DUF1579)
MYEFPKPGAEQETLTKLSGDWKSEVKFYFAPDAPPMVKPGTYRARLDLGGYFLRREFRVDLDDAGDFKALAFHGYGLTGYDPFERKYRGVWADSGSPALYLTEGSFNAAGDVYTETSRGPDPTGKPLVMRMVTTLRGRDRLSLQMYRIEEGGTETLITEMDHVRL